MLTETNREVRHQVTATTDGVTGERFAGRAGEEWVRRCAGVFVEPVPDELSGGFVERGDADFSPHTTGPSP